MKKINLVSVGFLQATGVVLYCFLVGAIMQSEPFKYVPMLVVPVFMLSLLVFSAAVSGSLVFGYPVYLAFNKEIKKAIMVFLYTLLFVFLIVASFVGTVLVLN